MSLFDVHPSMRVLDRRARQGADEALLDVRDPALSLFLDEVRALQRVSAPAPVGDLAALLQDGFEATPQATRPLHRRRTTGGRRVSRVAVIAAPLGMKIATAAFAAAATFGGAAALGVLPDWLLPWSGNHAGGASVDGSSAPPEATATAPAEAVADFLPVRGPDPDASGLGALDAAAARSRAAAEREDRRPDADQERRGPDEDAGEKAEGAADEAVRDQEDAEDAADDERDTTEGDDAPDEDADDADDAPEEDADDADDAPDQDADDADDAPDQDADDANDAPEDDADDAVDRTDDAVDDATDAAEGAVEETKNAEDAADGVEDPNE